MLWWFLPLRAKANDTRNLDKSQKVVSFVCGLGAKNHHQAGERRAGVIERKRAAYLHCFNVLFAIRLSCAS